MFHDADALVHLLLDLVGAAEDVGIVLSETTHAGHTTQLTTLLPAVHGTELCQAHGQITVGVRLAIVNADVVRAVHGLEHETGNGLGIKRIEEVCTAGVFITQLLEVIRVRDGRELALFVVSPVAGGHVQIQLTDVRGIYLGVADAVELLRDEILQLTANDRALGFPQHEALPHHFIDGEKPQLSAKLAVISLAGFLQAGQVLIQLSAVGETGAVYTLQARAIGIALVVGGGHAHHLESLAVAGAANVRAGAKVRKVAIAIYGNLLILGDAVEQVHLILGGHRARGHGAQLTGLRHLHSLCTCHGSSLECLILLDDFLHLSLNQLKL